MRPEKLHTLVNKGFDAWLAGEGNKPLTELLPDMKKEWQRRSKKEQDFRTGEETYGYCPNSIRNNMVYISDRWCCAFRLRWLIDGLENGSI